MKSEDELDAEIEQISASDPERAAKIHVLQEHELWRWPDDSVLQITMRRLKDLEEAEALSAEPSRARRNTKNNFVDAIRKLDKRIDKRLDKHGLQGEVETFRRGSGAPD